MENIILKNGVTLPAPGFGTWTLDDKAAEKCVRDAINCGYRHIDTAEYYKNELGIGAAIKDVPRKELFITSKLWTTSRGYDNTISAFNASCARLGVGYLDLYLIHWPAVPEKCADWREVNLSTWRALETLYKEEKIRAIGVSNFMPLHLSALMEDAEIAPMVNQIEFHPGYMQNDCVEFCKQNGIALEAWAPLGHGEALSNEVICEIAKRLDITPATVTLSWVCANGLVPLVKSANPERMKENMNTVELSRKDIDAISALEFWGKLGKRPENVPF